MRRTSRRPRGEAGAVKHRRRPDAQDPPADLVAVEQIDPLPAPEPGQFCGRLGSRPGDDIAVRREILDQVTAGESSGAGDQNGPVHARLLSAAERAKEIGERERAESGEHHPEIEPPVGRQRNADGFRVVELLVLELEAAALGHV